MSTLPTSARVKVVALFLLAGLLHVSASPPAAAAVNATLPKATVPLTLATPTPAATAPNGGDLGLPTKFALASTVSDCGNGFVTQSEVLKCPSAIAAHKLVFVWSFDPNSCTAKPCLPPDGFNLVRLADGSANTFQKALGADHGAILQVTGDDVIGSCFYVVPFRGAADFGRRSTPSVCVDQTDHIVENAGRVGTAHSYSHDDGTSCKSPDSNPAGYGIMGAAGNGLVAGYITRSGGTSVAGALADALDPLAQAIAVGESVKNAGNNTCNHYRDIYQGLMYFDLTKIAATAAGKKVTKATLDIDVTSGAYNGGSSSGGDGSEHAGSPAPNCAATIGFPTNVNTGSDINYPDRIAFDTFTKINGGVGHISVDITGMMVAWLHPGGVNRGIVISPGYLDPTHAPAVGDTVRYNADCMSKYGTPKLTVDLQGS